MKTINYEHFNANKNNLMDQWNDVTKPFSYLILDDFFDVDFAEKVLQEYPEIETNNWESKTYINQRNKFVKTTFSETESHIAQAINELNNPGFINKIGEITGIEGLSADADLYGGGLHQSINGAFLDVHVDFNIHPKTKMHRRLNIILYMNKEWEESFNGYLELWDMDKKIQLENIKPEFNRCVIFETNEVSYHGHPKKLNTPVNISRKSLALYYYTLTRDENEVVDEHNTIYVNTEGVSGKIKNLKSGLKALKDRLFK